MASPTPPSPSPRALVVPPRRLENLGPRQQLRLDRLPLRLTTLMLGLTGYGVGLALVIRSGLGVSPWDVLHVALAERTGLSVGTVIILMSIVVLAAWLPLRQLAGIGTLANALWVGVAVDLALAVVPAQTALPGALLFLLGGILLTGVSDAVYIGAQLGPGPRDGLMTGIHHRWGLPLGPTRIALEITVLAAGWSLGGPVGLGTVVFVLALGPVLQLVLPRVTIPVPVGVLSPHVHPRR